MEAIAREDEKVGRIRDRAWDATADLPAHVAGYPSMLTAGERRMLRWLAAERYSGRGVICDLGAFLGGSTIALADGVRAGGRGGKVIHSYDRHRIRPESWEHWGLAARRPYPESGNFLPVTRELMGDLAELVEFHSGDFLQFPAPDAEIEVLFVDIAKVKATIDHVVADFFPRLIPGWSIVVQQDYFHLWPPFDIYVMELLRDHFEPLSFAGTSAVFLCVRAVDAGAVERALSRNMSIHGLRAALDSAAGRWPPAQQAWVRKIRDALEGVDEVPDSKAALQRATGQALSREERARRRAKRRQRLRLGALGGEADRGGG